MEWVDVIMSTNGIKAETVLDYLCFVTDSDCIFQRNKITKLKRY